MEDDGFEVGHRNGMDTDENQFGEINGYNNGNYPSSSEHKARDKEGERRKKRDDEKHNLKEIL